MHGARLDTSRNQSLAELRQARRCLELRAALGRRPENLAGGAGSRPQDVVDGGVIDGLAPAGKLAAEHKLGLLRAEVGTWVVRVDQAPVLVRGAPVWEGVEARNLILAEVEPLTATAVKVLYSLVLSRAWVSLFDHGLPNSCSCS